MKNQHIDLKESALRFFEKNFGNNEKFKKNLDNKTFAVAYSGGVDSSVLLDVMIKLKSMFNFNLVLVHINYNLRGEDSILDMVLAKDKAKIYGIPIYIKEIELSSFEGKNLELKAREDRYSFFEKLYREKKYDYILIAHNKDDLIETIIYRIIKGSGSGVLSSMKSKTGYILRPLINVYRKHIDDYALKNSVEYREDKTNKTDEYTRNKLRNTIIPMLEDINSKAKDNIFLFCKRVYKETSPLRKKVNIIYKNIVRDNTLDLSAFKRCSNIIKDKLIVKYLAKNKIEITEKRVKECKKIIMSKKPNIKILFDKTYLYKSYNFLYFAKHFQNAGLKELKIKKDGIYNFEGESLKISVIKGKDINLKDGKIYLSLDYPFIIRNRKHGDIIYTYPKGSKKYLRKVFIDLKIPEDIRNKIPVIEKNGEIAAVALGFFGFGFHRLSLHYAVMSNSSKIVVIEKI